MIDGSIAVFRNILLKKVDEHAEFIADGGCTSYENYLGMVATRRAYMEMIKDVDEAIEKNLKGEGPADE